MTASTSGTITITVAVLLSLSTCVRTPARRRTEQNDEHAYHMDSRKVDIINPSRSPHGRRPRINKSRIASRRCKCHFSIAAAIKKVPNIAIIVSFQSATNEYEETSGPVQSGGTSDADRTPNNGSKTMGSIAVTASGTVSVIHQRAIHSATAPVRYAREYGSLNVEKTINNEAAGATTRKSPLIPIHRTTSTKRLPIVASNNTYNS